MRRIRRTVGTCALALMLLLTACTPRREPGLPEPVTDEIRLSVQEAPVIYSDAERTELSARLASLGASAVRALSGAVLTPNETKALAALTEQVYLPLFQARAVTFAEITQLCREAEFMMSHGGFPDVFVCYQTAVSLLGVRRAGLLAFDIVSQWLRDKAEQCRERYEIYGYAWYLEDENNLRSIESRLRTDMGEERFANACALAVFCGSFGAGVFPTGGEQTERVTNAEVLLILRRQAEVFAAWNITAEQWRIAAEALAQVLPSGTFRPDSLNDYQSAEWSALKEEGWFLRMAQTAPALIRLFTEMTAHLKAEDIGLLRYGSENERLAVFCRLLISAQDAFSAFLSAAEPLARIDTARERSLITRKELTGDFTAFSEQIFPATAQKLINAVELFGNMPTEEHRAELLQTARDYCFEIAPCATFAFFRTIVPEQKGEQT